MSSSCCTGSTTPGNAPGCSRRWPSSSSSRSSHRMATPPPSDDVTGGRRKRRRTVAGSGFLGIDRAAFVFSFLLYIHKNGHHADREVFSDSEPQHLKHSIAGGGKS
ncbi:hypothetical protein INR49_030026 [Caranx melampygus]|nr:hypothetical protein INR49_030032 [Caranx melampygus]KAG7239094.1 hypothetical protein INR49_030026 [Caranx melampygus]